MRKNEISVLQIITPYNLKEEKEKFLNSRMYTPIFKYRWERIKERERINKMLTHEHNTHRKAFIKAVINQEVEKIVKEGEVLFDTKIDHEILKLAQNYTKKIPIDLEKPPTFEQIKKAFDEAFKALNIQWKVIQSPRSGFNFRMNSLNKYLLVGKDVNWDFFTLSGMVRHEVAHLIRIENRNAQKHLKSFDYLPTEEGLATYLHDFKGSLAENKQNIFRHALEYEATEVALKGNLRDVYNFFVSKGFSKNSAWQRAARHKYGIKDTALPGDSMKSAMYFYWENKIKNLSNNEILRLFTGAISINDLPKYPKYKGIVDKERIKEFYNI